MVVILVYMEVAQVDLLLAVMDLPIPTSTTTWVMTTLIGKN